MANRESRSSWKKLLLALRARSLHGVERVVADDHAGLHAAIRKGLAEAAFQRCSVPFLKNALAYRPRKADDDCRQELRWLSDRRSRC